jgi:hypothetical protein
MPPCPSLQRQLQELEDQIREAEACLPAHSVKPVLMARVLDLEDRREALLARLRAAGCP